MILVVMLSIAAVLIAGYSAIMLSILKFGSREPEIKKDPSYQPTVSIVIPTMNEARVIEKRLENILAIDYPKEKLEVIFVDNSTDITPQVIAKYHDEYPFIKLLKQEKEGFNNALNQGYSAAKGEIVIKSDCTAFPHADALKKMLPNFGDPSVGAVCGIHVFPQSSKSVEKEFKDIQYKIQKVEAYFHSSLISHGALGACRKNLIPRLPEAITADDSEVVVNVIKHGYRAIIDETVKSEEQSPEDFKERREQKNRRAAGVIRVILSNLGMLFNKKFGAFGFISFPMELFVLIITPVLVSVFLILFVCLAVVTWSPVLFVMIGLLACIVFISVKFSTRAKAIFDTYISCCFGLFQAFTKKKKWK